MWARQCHSGDEADGKERGTPTCCVLQAASCKRRRPLHPAHVLLLGGHPSSHAPPTCRVWDIETGIVRSTIKSSVRAHFCVAVTPLGTSCVTGSDDRYIR